MYYHSHNLREKLRANCLLKQYQLEVDLRHTSLYNDEIAHAIQEKPGEILPLVCICIAFIASAISTSLQVRIWCCKGCETYRLPKNSRSQGSGKGYTQYTSDDTIRSESAEIPRPRCEYYEQVGSHSRYCYLRVRSLIEGNKTSLAMSSMQIDRVD